MKHWVIIHCEDTPTTWMKCYKKNVEYLKFPHSRTILEISNVCFSLTSWTITKFSWFLNTKNCYYAVKSNRLESNVFINFQRALVSVSSLKSLPKILSRSLFLLKMESYSLQHCKKKCHMLHFAGIFSTITSKIHVWKATRTLTGAVAGKCSVKSCF